ncbi:MAG: ribonuclease H-like domain-containing protein [Clostridium sp.]|nr:ribonuclease H-like domain-containing protein [Clostridium sp.]
MLAIDIETIPDLSMVDLLPDVKADSRLKDPEKVAKDLEEKKAKQIDSMALNPMFAKIVCIGIYGDEYKYCLAGDEKSIIEDFIKITNKKSIVTWNGKGYDYDVILKRGLLYDCVKLPTFKWFTNKYNSGFHTDLMQEFCGNNYEKLNTVARVYLGEQKHDIDVKEIPSLIKTQQGLEKVKEYCLKDAELTYKLAKKFGFGE